jgi:hypothetical protein
VLRVQDWAEIRRLAEEPLPPVRVVQPLIVRGGSGDGRVEYVGAADHGDGRERSAVGSALDADPRPVQVGELDAERVERVDLIVQRRGEGIGEHCLGPLRSAAGRAAPVSDEDGEALLGEPLVLADQGLGLEAGDGRAGPVVPGDSGGGRW